MDTKINLQTQALVRLSRHFPAESRANAGSRPIRAEVKDFYATACYILN
jgi:hypothetical protein